MKTSTINFCALFCAFVTALVVEPDLNISLPGLFRPSPHWIEYHQPEISASKSLVNRAEDVERVYYVATCKGQKLLTATTYPRNTAAAYVTPIDSPWVNHIQNDLTTWGYKLETDDGTPQWRASHFDECEFATNHKLKTMFDSLSILTRSTWQNGPNRCYFIHHKDGPAVVRDAHGNLPPANNQWYYVNGRPYRVSTKQTSLYSY